MFRIVRERVRDGLGVIVWDGTGFFRIVWDFSGWYGIFQGGMLWESMGLLGMVGGFCLNLPEHMFLNLLF